MNKGDMSDSFNRMLDALDEQKNFASAECEKVAVHLAKLTKQEEGLKFLLSKLTTQRALVSSQIERMSKMSDHLAEQISSLEQLKEHFKKYTEEEQTSPRLPNSYLLN